MKRMNQNKFNSNYLKPVKTKEHIEYKERVKKILNMIDIKNINIEMFHFLLENKTFKKEVKKIYKRFSLNEIDFIEMVIIDKDKTFFKPSGDILNIWFISEDQQIIINNTIKQAFNKAIKRNHYLIEDFELMFAY